MQGFMSKPADEENSPDDDNDDDEDNDEDNDNNHLLEVKTAATCLVHISSTYIVTKL
jgi:hypothetical protein